jgi:hypothetical protein
LRGFVHAHVGWLFRHDQRGSRARYATDLLANPVIRFVDRTFDLWALGGLALAFGFGGDRREPHGRADGAAARKASTSAVRSGATAPDDEQARRVILLLLGNGAVLAHRLAHPLAAESDDDQQSRRGPGGTIALAGAR